MLGSIRRVWRKLAPDKIRRAAGQITGRIVFETTLQTMSARKGSTGVGTPVVAGLFRGASGVALSAQLASRALDRLGIAHQRMDVANTFLPTEASTTSARAWLFYINPPELMHILSSWDLANIAGPLFGHWAWELPKAPNTWIRAVGAMDGVMAQSSYTASAFESAGQPVSVTPHPMFEEDFANVPRKAERAVSESFRVVNLFDFGSSYSRKNPMGALKAFEQAFADDPAVRLIFKTQNSHLAPTLASELRGRAGPNVEVIDDIWDRERVLSLIASADALISLHRAEGFGLTMAEAMILGVPVIATGWSGNLSFMDETTACIVGYKLIDIKDPQNIYSFQNWAEPDIDSASHYLRRLREDSQFAATITSRAKARIIRQLNPEAWFETLPPLLRQAFTASPPVAK